MEDRMTDITNFTRHLPTVIEIQRLDVETIDSSVGCYFVRLKLAGNDLWVQGTPVWHNRMTLPDCFATLCSASATMPVERVRRLAGGKDALAAALQTLRHFASQRPLQALQRHRRA